jgi:hypothetical protein
MNRIEFAVLTAMVTWGCAVVPAHADIIVTDQAAASDVSIRSVTDAGGTVTGVIVNDSPHTVGDVRLLIHHAWLWNNEYSPGADDPGKAVFYTLPEKIPAGTSVGFTYRPEPMLPMRSDGRFLTSAEVAAIKIYQ